MDNEEKTEVFLNDYLNLSSNYYGDSLSCTGKVVDLTYGKVNQPRLLISIYCKRQNSNFMDTYKWTVWGAGAIEYMRDLKVGMRVKVKGFYYVSESESTGKKFPYHIAETVEILAGVENKDIDNVDEMLGD